MTWPTTSAANGDGYVGTSTVPRGTVPSAPVPCHAAGMEYTPLDLLTGPETYERLSLDARRRFDTEWESALAAAEKDFDGEALVLLVCRWWLVAGGDPARAAYTRSEWMEMCAPVAVRGGSLAPRCPRTAAAGLFDVLAADERVELAEAWARACREAVVVRDWHGLWGVVAEAYDDAHRTDANNVALRVQAAASATCGDVPSDDGRRRLRSLRGPRPVRPAARVNARRVPGMLRDGAYVARGQGRRPREGLRPGAR